MTDDDISPFKNPTKALLVMDDNERKPMRMLDFGETEESQDRDKRMEMLDWPVTRLIDYIEVMQTARNDSLNREALWDKIIKERGSMIQELQTTLDVRDVYLRNMFERTIKAQYDFLRQIAYKKTNYRTGATEEIPPTNVKPTMVLYLRDLNKFGELLPPAIRRKGNGRMTSESIYRLRYLLKHLDDMPEAGSFLAEMACIYTDETFLLMPNGHNWTTFIPEDGEGRNPHLWRRYVMTLPHTPGLDREFSREYEPPYGWRMARTAEYRPIRGFEPLPATQDTMDPLTDDDPL